MSAQSTKEFVKWLEWYEPQLYDIVSGEFGGTGLQGMFDWVSNVPWDSVVNTAVNVGQQYLMYQQQKDILELQAQRAYNNQPPVYSYTAANVPISNKTAAEIEREALELQALKILPWALGALVLVRLIT